MDVSIVAVGPSGSGQPEERISLLGISEIIEASVEVAIGGRTLRFIVNEEYWRVRQQDEDEHGSSDRPICGGDDWTGEHRVEVKA